MIPRTCKFQSPSGTGTAYNVGFCCALIPTHGDTMAANIKQTRYAQCPTGEEKPAVVVSVNIMLSLSEQDVQRQRQKDINENVCIDCDHLQC